MTVRPRSISVRCAAMVFSVMSLVIVGAGSLHGAGEGKPLSSFDVTIERGTDEKPSSRHFRKQWNGCEYFEQGGSRIVYIDMPAGDDYYTRQFPGHRFAGTQFGLNLRTGLAWIRVYFGPRAYVYAHGGAYEPVYYQRWFYRAKGHIDVTGGLRTGSVTVRAEGLRIWEGFPWYFGRFAKGSTVTWRNCTRTTKRNIHVGIFEGQGSRSGDRDKN